MIEWEKIPEAVERERIEKRKALMTEAVGIASKGMAAPEDKKLHRASARRFHAIADELDTLTPEEKIIKEEYKSQGPPGPDQGVIRRNFLKLE